MAVNKNATIRYHALDRCFGNFGRRYYIDDLVEACNEALYEFNGNPDMTVKKRQVYDDIVFMESEQGWSAPIDRIKDGRKTFIRYADKDFSISNKGINPSEIQNVQDTLAILSRFKGLPQFEWIEEIQVRLEDTFKLKGDSISFVSFEENPYLRGLNYFSELFNAIQHQQTLKIEYQGYRQVAAAKFIFHPWHLKQFNNRWFVFGLNSEFGSMSNLAIDRIQSLEQTGTNYIRNKEINFETFFEDVIGVTVNSEVESEKIRIRIDQKLWPYIESKPLHGSQKIKNRTEEYVEVELDLQINHELKALLFSHMNKIEIIEPKHLREEFKAIADCILEKHSD